MRAKELRERKQEELERMLKDSRSELFRFRLQNATHQFDKTHKIRALRREIARINTVLSEKALDVESNSDSAKGGEE